MSASNEPMTIEEAAAIAHEGMPTIPVDEIAEDLRKMVRGMIKAEGHSEDAFSLHLPGQKRTIRLNVSGFIDQEK